MFNKISGFNTKFKTANLNFLLLNAKKKRALTCWSQTAQDSQINLEHRSPVRISAPEWYGQIMAKQPLTAGINDVCSVNSGRNLFPHSARAELNEAEQERVNNQHKARGSKYTLLRPIVSLLPAQHSMSEYNVWT